MNSSEKKSSVLKSSSGVAFANFASRLLGMLRDILTASFIGADKLMTAWIIAFMIPNLLRRLLGEGALGTVLIPIISHDLKKDKTRKAARTNFMLLFALLGLLLTILTILAMFASLSALIFVHSERIRLILLTIPIIMPYTVFICLSGIASAALNSVRHFFLPALSSLLLNIALIAVMICVIPLLHSDISILHSLSVAVLFSGIIQLILMLIMLKKNSLFTINTIFDSVKEIFKLLTKKSTNPFLSELWRLFIPGMIGAASLQVSFLTDRLLALYLGNYAAPALYYSDRIVFITVGIFAVSLGSVLLPNMSASAADKDYTGISKTIQFGIRQLMFICIPAMLFTFVFRDNIIKLLFMRGRFDIKSLNEVSWALAFYVFGIPFFASMKVLQSGFYSRKDMKTPVKISVSCIVLNIILNLILMWPLRQGGLALATVIASLLNNTILILILKKELKSLHITPILTAIARFTIAGCIAIYTALQLQTYLIKLNVIPHIKNIQGLEVIPTLFTAAAVYLVLSLLFSRKEVSEWVEILNRKKKK